MESVFDPAQQLTDVDSKIVAALERMAQALRHQLWSASQPLGLSPIQAQFLIFLRFHEPSHCRVSLLAQEFGLTKATVSDAVTALEAKGLVSRQPSPDDARVRTLRLTPLGRRLTSQIAQWADPLRDLILTIPENRKEIVLEFLLQLISALHRAGVITVARTCLTCAFFEPNAHPDSAAPHHCRLLNQPITVLNLRLDCPDHQTSRTHKPSP